MDEASSDVRSARGRTDVIVAFVSLAIAFLVLACRLFTRTTVVKNVGADDYVIAVSFIFSVALSALIYVEYQNGQGQHIASLSQENLGKIYKALWASIPIYSLSLTLNKISILLQYWRVFASTMTRHIVMVLFAVTTIIGFYSVFATIFMCAPVSYFWKPEREEGHCLDRNAVWFANASLNIITDVAIFILPMPVLHQLHLPKRQRYALMGVFGLGAFVCVTSMVRLKALYTISNSQDVTWDNGSAAAWSSLEVNVGIVCASLPTLRKSISRFFPKALLSGDDPQYEARRASRRFSRKEAGFHRFRTAQEASDWAEALPVPSNYGKGEALIGLDSKVERGSTHEDFLAGAGSGNIRVKTVTTQVVQELGDASVPVTYPLDAYYTNDRDNHVQDPTTSDSSVGRRA
ncbi:hypothetical protein AAFC00_005497 [Neodothiora populina]|uniref:Rhodopsin domain-containing protein n=1 Tax=Neodothiora populina TaxID=2781224 RepID=A0ABR3PL23_9PEZI